MNANSRARLKVPTHCVLLTAALVALGAPSHAVAASSGSVCESRAIRDGQVLAGASLENWEPVNDRTVLIWTGHDKRAYLVRLDRPLAGLTAAATIDLLDGDHDRSISACGHDGVTISEGGDGTIARIVAIELLSYRRTMELDPAARRAAPDSLRT